MKKISSLHIALGVLILASVALGALYFYLLSSLMHMKESRAEVVGEVRDLAGMLEEEVENEQKFAQYFLKEGGQAPFISSLESSCARLSLECITRSLNESADPAVPTKVLGITLSAKGSFKNIKNMLGQLEVSPYPIMMEKVVLTLDEGVWVSELDLTVPVLVP